MVIHPSVCIVIPTYNQSRWIGRAIESALAQDYPNKWILVMDDCSRDKTYEVVEPYTRHGNVFYHRHEMNLGRVGNYRSALHLALPAKWVINLDGDDYFTNPRFISIAIEHLEKYSNAIFFQGVSITKYADREDVAFPKIGSDVQALTGSTYFLRFFQRNSFSHLATVYNRQFALDTPFYSIDCTSSDLHSILKMSLLYPQAAVIVSKEIAGVWFQHENNKTGSLSWKDHQDNLKAYWDLFKLAKRNLSILKACIWISVALYYYLRQTIGRLLK